MNDTKKPWPGDPFKERWKVGKVSQSGTVQIRTESDRFIVGHVVRGMENRICADHNACLDLNNPVLAMELLMEALELRCVECGGFGPDCYTDKTSCKTGNAMAALGKGD